MRGFKCVGLLVRLNATSALHSFTSKYSYTHKSFPTHMRLCIQNKKMHFLALHKPNPYSKQLCALNTGLSMACVLSFGRFLYLCIDVFLFFFPNIHIRKTNSTDCKQKTTKNRIETKCLYAYVLCAYSPTHTFDAPYWAHKGAFTSHMKCFVFVIVCECTYYICLHTHNSFRCNVRAFRVFKGMLC